MNFYTLLLETKNMMFKLILVLLSISFSGFSNSLTILVTEYGFFKKTENGSEKVIDIKSLGGIYHIDKERLSKKGGEDWILLSKNKEIKKSSITPLSEFKQVGAQKYLNGCFVYYEPDSETHIRLNNTGDIVIKRDSISEGKITVEEFTAELKIHRNVVVLIKDKNEIIFSSEISEKDDKLLVFNDPKFNEWEIQFVIKDCITGEWISPKKLN